MEQTRNLIWCRNADAKPEDAKDIPAIFRQAGFQDLIIVHPSSRSIDGLLQVVRNKVTANRGVQCGWLNNTTELAEHHIPGIGTFHHPDLTPSDLGRLMQAIDRQGKFIKLTNGGNPVTQGAERNYATFADFCKDARPCLVGFDGWEEAISAEEELAMAYALFVHAGRPKEALVLGRSEDRLHTGIVAAHGLTNEWFAGGVMHPLKWTALVNEAFMAGGIKAGIPFLVVTNLASFSRDDIASGRAPRTTDDFRNDSIWLRSSGGDLEYPITTVTAIEIKTLADYGYEAVPHPKYGVIFQPNNDPEFIQKRRNLSLIDLRVASNELLVAQVVDNLSTTRRVADLLEGFLNPPSIGQDDRAKLCSYLDGLRAKGVPSSHPNNVKGHRTNIPVASALGELAAASPTPLLTQGMLRALSAAALWTAKGYFDSAHIGSDDRELLLLAIDRQIAKDVAAGQLGQGFSFYDWQKVQSYIDANKNTVQSDPILAAAIKFLDWAKPRFEEGLSSHKIGRIALTCAKFAPISRDTVWDAFKQAVGHGLALLQGADVQGELGVGFVVEFLNGFRFVSLVESNLRALDK